MPTQNRRVATYLPPHIDEPFKAFKSQRDIRGDSEALIVVLSEYFQVSQEVAYPSSSNLLQRIEAIEERLGSLKSELLGELKSKLQSPVGSKIVKKKGEPFDELQRELLVSHEPQLSEDSDKLSSELLGGSIKLQPMTQKDLAVRLKLTNEKSLGNKRSKHKEDSQAFLQWSKSRDKGGIAWEYHEDDKLYHPVQGVNSSQERGA